jgi:cell division protein FtsW (lipid II flippase)
MDASIYRMKYRDVLTLCVIALLCLGVIMVQSASMRVTDNIRWKWTAAGMAQLRLSIIALATYFIIGRIETRRSGSAASRHCSV